MINQYKCPIEGFSIIGFLGDGGNGDVYHIQSDDGLENFALKVLRKVQDVTYDRFKIEVNFLNEIDISGVMPLIDYYLPENLKKDKAWYVMPLATTFRQHIVSKSPIQIVTDFIPLVQTVAELHEKKISHRDIKPDNFLFFNERVYLADFGLVKYPERIELTPDFRDVGAKFTMAPEMRRIANKADGIPADIYSLAKSLWMALTKEFLGFDGQYVSTSSIGLNHYIKDLLLSPLDKLLEQSTSNDPEMRPTAQVFLDQLSFWVNINQNFIQRNLTEWFEIQNLLFPFSAPARAEWNDVREIVSVLNLIASRQALNHMFYPTGGGNDLISAELAAEEGFIALIVSERSAEVLKPKKLVYESFGYDPEWNYFWLECEDITPTGITTLGYKGMDEYLIELSPGRYIEPSGWEINEYQGVQLPLTSRIISRYITGSFVFFCKSSTYNHTSATYDAWQNRGETKFRDLISRSALFNNGKRPIMP
jgi:serine/threonine-protein kinase